MSVKRATVEQVMTPEQLVGKFGIVICNSLLVQVHIGFVARVYTALKDISDIDSRRNSKFNDSDVRSHPMFALRRVGEPFWTCVFSYKKGMAFHHFDALTLSMKNLLIEQIRQEHEIASLGKLAAKKATVFCLSEWEPHLLAAFKIEQENIDPQIAAIAMVDAMPTISMESLPEIEELTHVVMLANMYRIDKSCFAQFWIGADPLAQRALIESLGALFKIVVESYLWRTNRPSVSLINEAVRLMLYFMSLGFTFPDPILGTRNRVSYTTI